MVFPAMVRRQWVSLLAAATFAMLLMVGCSSGGKGGTQSSQGPGSTGYSSQYPAQDTHLVHRGYGGRSGVEAAIGDCFTCHDAHNGVFRLSTAVVLPGGTSTAGATMQPAGMATTCMVACHFPFGGQPRQVTWTETINCASCHTTLSRLGTARVSSHDPMFGDIDPASGQLRAPATTADKTWCWSCHYQPGTLHASGTVQLQSSIDAVCIDCHSGQGQTLRTRAGNGYQEKTPPVLRGWTDTVKGDFHGARAGAGYGGTLLPPYTRGQAPLPCRACHAVHESGNPFLIAATVNGKAIPTGAISRSGVGAEALCEACHQGERHQTCKGCHTARQDTDNGGFDPTYPPVDPMPAGSPCFFCHGHEGIRNWTAPDASGGMGVPPLATGCKHCHGMPAPAANPGTAPGIRTGMTYENPFMYAPSPPVYMVPSGTVYGVTPTSATIYWETTGAGSTTWVEYGIGTAGLAVTADYPRTDPDFGSPARSWSHRVVLTGLTPGTTYTYRVRSSDEYRNTVEGPLATFTTPALDGPLSPVPSHRADMPVSIYDPPTVTFPLTWSAVTVPNGNPVQYRVQMGTDMGFLAAPLFDSGWISAASFNVTVTADWAGKTYFWRVKARDAVRQTESPWSGLDGFGVWLWDPDDY